MQVKKSIHWLIDQRFVTLRKIIGLADFTEMVGLQCNLSVFNIPLLPLLHQHWVGEHQKGAQDEAFQHSRASSTPHFLRIMVEVKA